MKSPLEAFEDKVNWKFDITNAEKEDINIIKEFKELLEAYNKNINQELIIKIDKEVIKIDAMADETLNSLIRLCKLREIDYKEVLRVIYEEKTY